MSRLKRPRSDAYEVLRLIDRKIKRITKPLVTGVSAVNGWEYGDEQPGGSGGDFPSTTETIDQECADNATTNIEIGPVASIAAIHLAYQCTTGAYYEGGSAVLFTDGTNANCSVGARSYLGSGYCLDDDAPLDGDVNGGILRLKVTTKSLGGACDFRATYLTVEA